MCVLVDGFARGWKETEVHLQISKGCTCFRNNSDWKGSNLRGKRTKGASTFIDQVVRAGHKGDVEQKHEDGVEAHIGGARHGEGAEGEGNENPSLQPDPILEELSPLTVGEVRDNRLQHVHLKINEVNEAFCKFGPPQPAAHFHGFRNSSQLQAPARPGPFFFFSPGAFGEGEAEMKQHILLF